MGMISDHCDRCFRSMGYGGWVIKPYQTRSSQERATYWKICNQCIADFEEAMKRFCNEPWDK